MIALALALALAPAGAAAERWKMQFFYDKDDSALAIDDFACPSTRRCVAVGELAEKRKKKSRGVAVVTGDGGENWSVVDLAERPRSVFFLNEQLGWAVTDKGIWRTAEAGARWTKLAKLEGAWRVWFLDERRGFAVGYPRAIYETVDGGKNWKGAAVSGAGAGGGAGEKEKSYYFSVVFATAQHGFILGEYAPGEARIPAWADPARFRYRRPATSLVVETLDGGKNWSFSGDYVFGQPGSTAPGDLKRLRAGGANAGLALVDFAQFVKFPSQVFQVNFETRRSAPVFQQPNLAVADAALPGGADAYLAAVERPGTLTDLPVPGALRMLRGAGFDNWSRMDVDYRAVARAATLAAPDAGHVWVATDTGMILKLVRAGK